MQSFVVFEITVEITYKHVRIVTNTEIYKMIKINLKECKLEIKLITPSMFLAI